MSLFMGGGAPVMLVLSLARTKKNRKYPSTCYATPLQVDHKVTAVLEMFRVPGNFITRWPGTRYHI